MPEKDEKGVIPPVTPTGEAGEKTPTPPVEEDKKGTEGDDKEGLIKALQEERRKRQEYEAKLKEREAQGEIDWGKILKEISQPGTAERQVTQPAQPPADQFAAFQQWFTESIESGDPARAWQAFMYGYGMLRSQETALEREARTIVPDYDKLPIHEVPDQLLYKLQQNPMLLKAVAARAIGDALRKGGTSGADQATQNTPATAIEKLQQEWIEKGRQAERERILALGKGGMPTEAPRGGSPPPSDEEIELDAASLAYLQARGKTPEEIKKIAKELAEQYRLRGLFGGTR